MSTVKKFYLAGPMSNVPQFNIPAFDQAASQLRSQGLTIVSPAELDLPEVRAACLESPDGAPTLKTSNGETWADFLARDVRVIADQVDGIVLLDNWYRSRGARLEAFVGLLSGKEFRRYYSDSPATLYPMSNEAVRVIIRSNMP